MAAPPLRIIHTAREGDLDRYWERDQEQWIPMYRNVHRQGKELEATVSYLVGPVPSTCSGPVPVQCEQAVSAAQILSMTHAVRKDSRKAC